MAKQTPPQAKVLPSNHEFVKRLLRDFRTEEAGRKFVAKIEGEGDSWWERGGAAPRQVFIRFQSEADWLKTRVSFARRWLLALRLHYLPFSLLPQVLVIGLLLSRGIPLSGWLVVGALASTTLLHLACNLWNDFEDHLRGIDSDDSSGGSGAIRNLWIPAAHIRNAAILLFIACVSVGFYLVGTLDWNINGRTMLFIGCIGTIGAASYSGWPFHYKYLALGEVLVFFLCGPLIAIGAMTLIAPGAIPLLALALAAYPLGLQAVLRLHSGNIRRIPYDIRAGARTIANLIGFQRATNLYLFLLAPLYALVPLVYFVVGAPSSIFLSYLSLPVAVYQAMLVHRMKGPLDPLAAKLRRSSTYLDLSFGLLYTLGFIF